MFGLLRGRAGLGWQSEFYEVFAMTKFLVLAAAATLMLSGSASAQDKAQDSGQKQLSNCHPPSSAAPEETSGSAKGPWDSQAVEKSAILPSVGGNASTSPTVQRHGQSVEVRSDCPPESNAPTAGEPTANHTK